jgi:hypothetical protein
VWRQKWEITRSDELKKKLRRYNMDDCRVLAKVKTFITAVIAKHNGSVSVGQSDDLVYCQDMRGASPFKFLTGDFALPEIEAIHRSSFFHYQRQKVFIRTDEFVRKAEVKRHKKRKTVSKPNKRQKISARICPKCKNKNIVAKTPHSRKIINLKFSGSGVKRWIIRFDSHTYYCNNCSNSFIPKSYRSGGSNMGHIDARSKYGHDLISWVIFQHIHKRQSFRMIESDLYELFHLGIDKSTLHGFKVYINKYYALTYERLVRKILKSKILYVDETPLKMRYEDGYAWVFTNNREIISIYKPTRDADFLKQFLKNFDGILVSDFYPAYDSIDCVQQKCLIHLIRDLNDDLLKHPFDEEFKSLTQAFTLLLQDIIRTVDKYGLKRRHLNKHKKQAESFLFGLAADKFSSEIARQYQSRFLKNKGKLFEFLSHDNVSWNNNNAEYAIKLLATHTNRQIKSFSAARIDDYLRIMSIYQTCIYNNASFLKFLLSKERDFDKYFDEHLR